MILRRVVSHFRKQEWTAIALDFAIVVIGVFIGLLLNDARERAALERGARLSLAQLLRDLDADLDRLDVVAEAQLARQEALAEFAAALADETQTDENLAAFIPLAVMTNRTLTARDTVYDVLESKGQLSVLPASLQHQITQTYAYDFPAMIEVGHQIDDAQDQILMTCLGRYWNLSTDQLLAETDADIAQFQSCLGFLAKYSSYYHDLTQGERRANAEALQAALRAQLGLEKAE